MNGEQYMKKVTDIIINGNGLREIYTAIYYAKMGKSVILATDGEYLFKEGSECLGGFFEKDSNVAKILEQLEIPYRSLDNALCHIPQGDASIYALKSLRKYGVYILFDTVKIGSLKKNEKKYGCVFANKFGVFCVEAKNVIEYTKCEGNSFSFQLSALKLDGITTPLNLGSNHIAKNIVLNRDSKENHIGVVSFDTDSKRIYKAFEKMLELITYLKTSNPIFEDCLLRKTAYSTDAYSFDDLSIDAADDKFECPDIIEMSGKEFPLDKYITSDLLDESLSFDAFMIKPVPEMAEEKSTSVVVSGAGTGGVCAYKGLKDEGIKDVIILDRAHLPGGTRTLGMVYAFWYGYQDGFAKKNKKDIDDYLKSVLGETKCRDYTGELLYYVHMLNDDCMYASYLCGAKCDGEKIDGVYVASDGKLTYIRSDLYIDATGDGDMAVFAGCKYRSCGDLRDGFPQSFSIWGETEAGKLWSESKYHGDEENISTEKYSEYVRGIIASDSVNSPDGFSPILTVRETRSILGEYTLNLKDIISGKIFDDTISVSKIYYDAHGQGTSRAYYTRLFDTCLTSTKEEPIKVRLPYRSLIPKGISNLLVVSKAISATRDGAGMVRMNPDIQNTAYASAIVTAYMIHNHIFDTRMAYDDNVRNKLISKDILPDWTFEPDLGHSMDCIRNKDMLSLARASMDEKNISELSECFNREKDDDIKYLYATALMGLKSLTPCEYMLDKLESMINTSDDIVTHKTDIMSIITLLSYAQISDNATKDRFMSALVTLVSNVTSGGDADFTGQSIYAASKIHATVVVNFKLLMALTYVCEENADELLIEPLRKLITKEGINIDENSDVFAEHLYMRLICALYRSGDKDMEERLKSYLDDEHYFFRTFARKELDEIKTFPCPLKEKWDMWI